MTNKTITLPRNLVEEVVRTCAFTLTEIAYQELRAALAAPVPPACCTCGKPTACGKMICEECCYEPLPVPPADEEPEVLQAVEDAMWGCFRDGVKEYRGCTRERVEETRSLIRAHVTRLQAEVERLKALNVTGIMLDVVPGEDGMGHEVYAKSALEVEEALGRMGEQVEELQFQVERLTAAKRQKELVIDGLSIENTELQSELTKARDQMMSMRRELNALIPGGYTNPDWPAPADKGQGEPVAWLYKESVYATGIGRVWREKIEREAPDAESSYIKDLTPLYAEQPAPVAVVMPERKTVKAGLLSESNTHNQGWNACLDEFTRLNSEPKP